MSTTKIINTGGAVGPIGATGAQGITGADGAVPALDLETRFRLLLKDYFLTFGQVPPGLENEISIALSTN